jgi:hypothetical protein
MLLLLLLLLPLVLLLLPVNADGVNEPTWEEPTFAPVSPACRALHTFTRFESNTSATCSAIILFGGFQFPENDQVGAGTLQYLDELWVFQANQQRWDNFALPNGPSPRAGHIKVIRSNPNISTEVLIFGGTDARTVFGDVWRLTFTLDICVSLGTKSTKRSGAGSWTLIAPNASSSSSSSSTALTPAPRWGHAGALLGDLLIVFGGFAGALRECVLLYV